jgi:hypothetical protein
MSQRLLLVPADFRRFLKEVVERIDSTEAGGDIDADDAFQAGCGYGGHVAGTNRFSFVYLPPEGGSRWVVDLIESQVRDVAAGRLNEVSARRRALVRPRRRPPEGHPLLVWGSTPSDALSVKSRDDLATALGALRAEAAERGPRAFRLWSCCDDLLACVIQGDECAFQVVWSDGGFATSFGNEDQLESFEARGVEGSPVSTYWCDCLPWKHLLGAAAVFAEGGELDPGLSRSERIEPATQKIAQGRREAELARIGTPPSDNLDETSLAPWLSLAAVPREDEFAWAERFVNGLIEQEYLALEEETSLEDFEVSVAALLQESGTAALRTLDDAEALAAALVDLDGVDDLFGTAEQIREVLASTTTSRH